MCDSVNLPAILARLARTQTALAECLADNHVHDGTRRRALVIECQKNEADVTAFIAQYTVHLARRKKAPAPAKCR